MEINFTITGIVGLIFFGRLAWGLAEGISNWLRDKLLKGR